jgi:hypothetical protein
MKQMTIALAAVTGLGLWTGTAAADPGGYVPPGPAGASPFPQMGGPGTLLGAGGLPPGQAPDCYGFHPGIKRVFGFFHRGGGGGYGGHGHNPLRNPANWQGGGYGVGAPAYNPDGFPPGAQGPIMQGTLAFPHHTFVRSPRDFFMLDVNK